MSHYDPWNSKKQANNNMLGANMRSYERSGCRIPNPGAVGSNPAGDAIINQMLRGIFRYPETGAHLAGASVGHRQRQDT